MKTLLLEEPRKLVLQNAESAGTPAAGEALVRVHRIGVCGTDIHAFGGNQPFFQYPRILGHELGLEVLSTGAGVTNVKAGDRCSLEPYVNCEKCIACRNGKGNCCVNMQVIGVHSDGGMREEFIVPARKLHVSNKLDYDQLALVEPLAIGCHAVERADVKADEYVLVIGAGPIGLAVIQFAVAKGAKVIVQDINEERLNFCKKHFLLTHTIHALHEDAEKKLLEITQGDNPTVVIDATGSPRSMMAAFQYPAHGGRLVFVGLFMGDVSFHDPNFHKRELTLLASRNAHSSDFTNIISMMENGNINVTPWITHRASIEDVPKLFSSWTQPGTGVIKAMIEVVK